VGPDFWMQVWEHFPVIWINYYIVTILHNDHLYYRRHTIISLFLFFCSLQGISKIVDTFFVVVGTGWMIGDGREGLSFTPDRS